MTIIQTPPLTSETTLVGKVVTQELSATGLTLYVQFEDKKLGTARTPQSTTRLFTLDKDNDRFEIVFADSHTTTDGITTITINANGRNLNKYGYLSGTGTGNRHPLNAEIGCVDVHLYNDVIANILNGTYPTMARNLKVGDATANNIYFYFVDAQGTPSFLVKDQATGKILISNDGVNTFDPEAGGSGVTAGDGINIVAGAVTVDTTDTTTFVKTSSGAVNENKVPVLGATGEMASGFVPASTLSDYISDVTATKDEINQALDGISANVTYTKLNTLTGGVASNADLLHTHASTTVTTGVCGEDSIVANNLLYLDKTVGKWKKVTTTATTWYNDLAIAQSSGDTDDEIPLILKGVVSGLNFANINPTFANAGTGTDNVVGSTAASGCMKAVRLDNTTGAEAVITAVVISGKQTGSPAGNLRISIVLPSATNSVAPACFWDNTNFTPIGAVLGSATIAQALFSGSYQNLTATFGSPIKIPAGAYFYIVYSMTTAPHGSNYYIVQSGAALNGFDQASGNGWVTPSTATNGNYTVTVTSTSPIGYAVKAYTGSDGSMGLTPTNPWSRVVGNVLSATTMFFDPNADRKSFAQSGYLNTSTSGAGYIYLTTNTCPSSLILDSFCRLIVSGPTSTYYHYIGWLRGDSTYATTFYLNYLSALNVETPTYGGTSTIAQLGLFNGVCLIRAIRMEDGIILYNEYYFDGGASINNYGEFIGGDGTNATNIYLSAVAQTN